MDADEPGLARRDGDAGAERPETLELAQRLDRLLQRREAVAQAPGVLEAKRTTEAANPGAERGQRRVDVVGGVALEGAGRAPGRPTPGQRAERRGIGGRRPAASATPQVDMPVRSRAARVRRRAELTEQLELLERRLELRAGLPPLDVLERPERGLDRGPLAAARAKYERSRARRSRARPT